MSEVRLCVLFLVMFVQYQFIATKPFLEDLWCEIFCEDDDVSTISSTTTGNDDFCSGCSSNTPLNVQLPPVFNISLPASSGMTMSLSNINGVWGFGLAAAPVATPAPPAAAATTPAAAVTPPAAGGTTVAATTAKK